MFRVYLIQAFAIAVNIVLYAILNLIATKHSQYGTVVLKFDLVSTESSVYRDIQAHQRTRMVRISKALAKNNLKLVTHLYKQM